MMRLYSAFFIFLLFICDLANTSSFLIAGGFCANTSQRKFMNNQFFKNCPPRRAKVIEERSSSKSFPWLLTVHGGFDSNTENGRSTGRKKSLSFATNLDSEASQSTRPESTTSLSNLCKDISPEKQALFDMLLDLNQEHLFSSWSAAGYDESSKTSFFEQVQKLDSTYPGGIRMYVRKARKLLKQAVEGTNPFENMVPSIPRGEVLKYKDKEFSDLENLGLEEVGKACFVLVAGGLGERLGYNGIKLELPVDILTSTSYLQFYAEYIFSLQTKYNAKYNQNIQIPFLIMTSDDTDSLTKSLLKSHQNFGLEANQVIILKQEKVPAIADVNGKLALNKQDVYELDTKPHGHGDVHNLLLESGLTESWLEDGKKWIFFYQDTNALFTNSILPTLGVSSKHNFVMNSICIPRAAGEAAGAITDLKQPDGSSLIINVEYNQLDPLLRATVSPKGDINDPETGFSPYPGNANNLLLSLDTYVKTINGKDRGVVDEFINPKFTDASKKTFLKPTRLECMMQDIPLLIKKEVPSRANAIGYTLFEKWLSFSPAKNSLEGGQKAANGGAPPATASSAEMEFFESNAKKLRQVNCIVENPKEKEIGGVKLLEGAKILLHPSFAVTKDEILKKINGGKNISISNRSTLILKGANIEIKDLKLDGVLKVTSSNEKAKIVIDGLNVQTDYDEFIPLLENDAKGQDDKISIRGYHVKKSKNAIDINVHEPGTYILRGDGDALKDSTV